MIATRINCAGQDGPARNVRALCGSGLNESGWPALPSLVLLGRIIYYFIYFYLKYFQLLYYLSYLYIFNYVLILYIN